MTKIPEAVAHFLHLLFLEGKTQKMGTCMSLKKLGFL